MSSSSFIPAYPEASPASAKLHYNVYPAPPALPAAPANEPNNNALMPRFAYDQVVSWWNTLEENQRQDILRAANTLTAADLSELRTQYAQYYPHEYYPQKIYEPGQLSTSDCCILYHCGDDLRRKNLSWFTPALERASQPRPPAYDVAVAPPPSYEEATRSAQKWFNSLSAEQQINLRTEASRLRPQQVRFIRERLIFCYPAYRSIYDTRPYYIDDFDLYLMSMYQAQFTTFIWFTAMRATLGVGLLAARGGWLGAKALGSAFMGIGAALGNIGSRARGGKGEDNKNAGNQALGLVIIGAIVAAGAVAIGGFVYAISKIKSSIANLIKGEKKGRSWWRLGCTTGGAVAGGIAGALLGAQIGTILFPGAGTLAGAIIGGIIGTGILAAVGAVIGKYTAQLVSWLKTGTTNPSRYDSDKAMQNMQQHGVVAELQNQGLVLNTQVIKEVLHDTQKAKSQFKALKGHPKMMYRSKKPGTPEHAEKQLYNKFTDALVKEGKNPFNPIRVDQNTIMLWNRSRHEIFKQNVEMPRPTGGLTL